MGDYACFVVRFDPAKAVPVLESLKTAGARDVQLFGNGAVMGLWKTSGGPSAIVPEINEVLYGVPGSRDGRNQLDAWQVIIVHERHNAVDPKTGAIEL